jgi:hypothetical protein
MSSFFKGLAEHAGKYIPTMLPDQSMLDLTMYLGQVLEVITGERIQEYIKSGEADQDGVQKSELYRYIGAILFKMNVQDNNKFEDRTNRIAFPIDKNNYRLPIPGELVLIATGYTSIDGVQRRLPFYTSVITGASYSTRNAVNPGAITPSSRVFSDNQLTPADNELLSRRFEKKLTHLSDVVTEEGRVVPIMREGDKVIEGRFGGTIRFTSTITNDGVWPTSSYFKGSNDGDPFLIIKNTKWLEPETNNGSSQYRSVDDDINVDGSSIYVNTTQNIPIAIGSSKTLHTWGFEIQRSDMPLPIQDPSARLQSFFSESYDPNFVVSVTADIPLQVGAFDDNFDGAKFGGAVQQIPPSAASTALEKVVVEALNLSFARGETKHYCARGTYNHAYNVVQRLRGLPGSEGMGKAAGGNANGSGYFSNLVRLGYAQYNQGTMTKQQLDGILKNGPGQPWTVGDVVTYWSNDGGADESNRLYGHTQMYIGRLTGVGNWTTDNKYNYDGSYFVYRGRAASSWNLIVFKPPQA